MYLPIMPGEALVWELCQNDFRGSFQPFFSAIVLFKNKPFPQVFGGFLKKRIPGKNGTVTPRMMCTLQPPTPRGKSSFSTKICALPLPC